MKRDNYLVHSDSYCLPTKMEAIRVLDEVVTINEEYIAEIDEEK